MNNIIEKYLIILDLDECIIYTYNDNNDIKCSKRPGLDEFLDSMLIHCDIGIWTSGSSTYANTIVSTILFKYINIIKFVWSKNKCQHIYNFAIPDNEFDLCEKYEICKPLSKLWKRSIAKKNNWNKKNTLIIEDDFDNCMKNKSNCIIIPKYTGDELDKILYHLNDYLLKIILTKNPINIYDKRDWLKNYI